MRSSCNLSATAILNFLANRRPELEFLDFRKSKGGNGPNILSSALKAFPLFYRRGTIFIFVLQETFQLGAFSLWRGYEATM